MSFTLFTATTSLPLSVGGYGPLTVSVTFDGPDQLRFALQGNGRDDAFLVNINPPADFPPPGGTLDEGLFELSIPLSDQATKDAFERAGLVGARMGAGATLSKVRIVLRAPGQSGDWTSEAPHFELHLHWNLTGQLQRESKVKVGNDDLTLGGVADVETEISIGLSAIQPDLAATGNFQTRIDVPGLGVTTGWIPIQSMLDLPSVHLDWLAVWFARLPDIDLGDWDFDLPDLPDWNLDLPLLPSLPLGIAVQETRLWLRMVGGGLVVEARAEGFYLTWSGQAVTDPMGRVALIYDTVSGTYQLTAVLFERQWPAEGETPADSFGFSLPFDVLGIKAKAWYVGLGFYFAANPEQNPGSKACFQALLEIGGLEISSCFAGSDGLYGTDLRLLIRDTTVITNEFPHGTPGPHFFAAARGGHFDPWRKQIPAYSFARDLPQTQPASPANDYGLAFIDGMFRKGERAVLVWKMNGRRLIKALAHDLLGGEAAGVVGDDALTAYALEWLTLPSGAAQIRLDWRGGNATTTWSGAHPLGVLKPGTAPDDHCVILKPQEAIAANLPLASPNSLSLGGAFDHGLSLALPGVRLQLARPRDQSLLLSIDEDGDWAASHLLIYDATPSLDPQLPLHMAPIAVAEVGFAVGGGSAKSLFETEESKPGPDTDAPFLTLGVGRKTPGAFAIRTIGWRKGQSPRFLQSTRPGSRAAKSLIPMTLDPGVGEVHCPVAAKPLPDPGWIGFDDFAALSLEQWQFSIRIAAESSLFRMFNGSGNTGQKVAFKIVKICEDAEDDSVALLHTELTFLLGASSLTGTVVFRFDLAELSVRIEDDARLTLDLKVVGAPAWVDRLKLKGKAADYLFSEPLTVLGLSLTAIQAKKAPAGGAAAAAVPDSLGAFELVMRDGQFHLGLTASTQIVLRYEVSGQTNSDIAFLVSTFRLGPGGLDLEASLLTRELRLEGLESSFNLTEAALRIVSGRMDLLQIKGKGKLPDILDNAPINVGVTFKQNATGAIELHDLSAELGERGKPIVSRGTRFKFEIEELDLYYKRGQGAWFEITGSASFNPGPTEFPDGLLSNLKSVRLEFTRLRLSDKEVPDVSLMVELNRPIRFAVFGIFEMEIRSVGLHPRFPGFEVPKPAVIIGGQIRFADAGDVIQAEIDFHRLYIGLPGRSALPQVHAKGLRVVISAAEGFRIGGRVDEIDDGRSKGFAGEGMVQVPGLPELGAAFAFVRVRDPEAGRSVRAWFIAIEASKISYLVGGALPIYLRQIGLGFGYRYTLPLIDEFSAIAEPRELIKAMLKALDQHQTLARIESWRVPENAAKRDWTIALEAVLSLGTTQPTPFDYNAENERRMRTIFAQFLGAFRSDFTLVAATKIWFPVSVDDFFTNKDGMRARPLAKGFIAYSAPRNRLLAHAVKGDNPYLGPSDDVPFPMVLKAALDASDFDMTLLVEPGLIHAELGWPDRLGWEFRVGPLTVACRGGILIRLERDLLLYGYYFSAHGELALGGGVDLGVVGIRIEAVVRVTYATRLLIGANTRNPLESHLYGAIGLDLSVEFKVRAWLRIKLAFVRITINISFSFSLQLTILGEIGWAGRDEIGFRGRAKLSISVFGRTLGIHVDVGVNKSGVEAARKHLLTYAQSVMEPGKAPVFPGLADPKSAAKKSNEAPTSAAFDMAPAMAAAPTPAVDDFVLSVRRGVTEGDDTLTFVWIMPGPNGKAFYPAKPDGSGVGYATLTVPELPGVSVYRFVPEKGVRTGQWKAVDGGTVTVDARLDEAVETDAVETDTAQEILKKLSLNQMLAGAHVPTWDGIVKNEVRELFPFSWPAGSPDLAVPDAVAFAQPLVDMRVFDPSNPARGLRRVLEPDNPWDRALEDDQGRADAPVPETPDDLVRDRREKALAGQALLLQGFYDDLCRLATDTHIEGREPSAPTLTTERPTLLDLGMVLCIRAKRGSLPDWAARRAPGVHLRMKIAGSTDAADILPAIDHDLVDFAVNPPDIARAANLCDEENLAVAWRLDWSRRPELSAPVPQIADGGRADIDGHIESYDIEVIDPTTCLVIHAARITHADTLVRDANGSMTALAPRFGFSIAMKDLLSGQVASLSRKALFLVSVVPNSHSGTFGSPLTFTADFAATLTPLPASEPVLTLSLALDPGKDGPPAKEQAVLTWRKPRLLDGGGAARTDGWRLVLRPLPRTPFGAYPDGIVDTSDRGLMGTEGTAPQDGDIVVPLTATTTDKVSYRFDLSGLKKDGPFFDRVGRPLAKDDPLFRLAQDFVLRQSAAVRGGRAWRMYLVSVAGEDSAEPEKALAAHPVSALVRVAPMLRATAKNMPLPVPHFEWPRPVAAKDLHLDRVDLTATAGTVDVPAADLTEADLQSARFTFKRGGGPGRAVTITWNALPANDGAPNALLPQAVAAYTVLERDLDGLTNEEAARLEGGTLAGFVPIGTILPSESARARETPNTMHDVENWRAEYPAGPPATWADHTLVWPAPESTLDPDQKRLYDLGLALARRPLHYDLAMLLGAMQDGRAMPDPNTSRMLRIEVLDGPPVPITDPLAWMAANSEVLDPHGWAALDRLGLSVVISVRDAVSGLLVHQKDTLGCLADGLQALGWDVALPPSLMIYLPVQFLQAYRAADRPGEVDQGLPQEIGLSMVRVALRPMARPTGTGIAADEGRTTWATLVAGAFARANPGAENTEVSRREDEARIVALLLAEVDGTWGLEQVYRAWAGRFLTHRPVKPGPPLAGHLSAARQLAADPLVVAEDLRGTLRLTRLIDEQWATARRYAVTAEGRYDRLLAALHPAGTTDAKPARFASVDVHLPRVRGLEQPTLLSLGNLRSRSGRQYHDVVITHAEHSLATRNHSVAAKLEFGEIRRSYDRQFARDDYLANLFAAQLSDGEGDGLLSGAMLGLAAPGEQIGPGAVADPLSLDDQILSRVPAARFGAIRYRDQAEPFYYRQTVTLQAVAGSGMTSAPLTLILPELDADGTVPLDPPPTRWQSVAAALFPPPDESDLIWGAGETEGRQTRAAAWTAAADARVTAHFVTGVRRLDTRLPRYVESVTPALRETAFRQEMTARELPGGTWVATAGLLPDDEARLVIFANDDLRATSVPVAQLVPVRGTPDPATAAQVPAAPFAPAFRATAVSTAVSLQDIGLTRVNGRDWTDGLDLAMTLCPRTPGSTVVADVAGITEITNLMPPTDGVVGDYALPDRGPMLCLAPLALRLWVQHTGPGGKPARTGLIYPPARLPRALMRPHLWTDAGVLEPTPGDATDLALAVRLLLDVGRRRAATLVAGTGMDRGRTLLHDVEEAALVYRADPAFALDLARLDDWRTNGLTDVWARAADLWVRLDTEVPASPTHLVVVVRRYRQDGAKGWTAVEVQTLLENGTLPTPLQDISVDPVRADALTGVARLVAQGCGPPLDLWQAEVRVMRGNAPPQRW